MIRAIIFDFDGVILDSAGLKTNAFSEMFAAYLDKHTEIVAYHCGHMGVSRYVKFRHIYENILKKSYNNEVEEQLGKEFESIVYQSVLKVSFIPGAREFLEKNSKHWPCFVASGTPEGELREVVKLRNLSGYFCEVHGSPRIKSEIVKDILDRHRLSPKEVLFIGDAETDREAAETNNVHFLGCGLSADQFSKPVRLVDNLLGLESYILNL